MTWLSSLAVQDVVMTQFSSLTALTDVILTTSSEASGENFVKMIHFPFCVIQFGSHQLCKCMSKRQFFSRVCYSAEWKNLWIDWQINTGQTWPCTLPHQLLSDMTIPANKWHNNEIMKCKTKMNVSWKCHFIPIITLMLFEDLCTKSKTMGHGWIIISPHIL